MSSGSKVLLISVSVCVACAPPSEEGPPTGATEPPATVTADSSPPPGPLGLSLVGACPGPVQVTVSAPTARGRVAILTADDVGFQAIPGGPCAGVATGLDSTLGLAAVLRAPVSGDLALTPDIPGAACGKQVQALDLDTCRLSPVADFTDTPPTVPQVDLTPAQPYSCQDLSCDVLVDSVDPDGGAITYTYAWTIDGVVVPWTQPVLPSGATAPGHRVACTVTASDGTSSVSATTPEVAVADEDQSDVFGVVDTPVDVLLVLDTSCSMSSQFPDVVAGMVPLVDALAASGKDWQVGMLDGADQTASRGHLLIAPDGAYVIDATRPDPAADLQSMVTSAPGGTDETLLQAVDEAVDEPLRSTVNDGFFRPGAHTAILYITDEDDQSPASWQSYRSSIAAALAPGEVVHSALWAGPWGCGIPTSGGALRALLLSTGGFEGDLCAPPYDADLQAFVDQTGGGVPRVFPLTLDPDLATLVTTYRDASGASFPLTLGVDYLYDPPTASIELLQAPDPGSTVIATYTGDVCRP